MDSASSGASVVDLTQLLGVDAVQAILHDLGKSDSGFLHRIVSSLLDATPDMLRPLAVLALAEAAGKPADERIVRFAAALQCVVAATAVHRTGAPGQVTNAPDHLEVLAGDYLYAQAAVLTSGLNHLSVMAGLSSAIKSLCRNGLQDASQHTLAPLYKLGAEAVGYLLDVAPEARQAMIRFGELLDLLASQNFSDDAQLEALRCASQFAEGPALAHLRQLTARVGSPAGADGDQGKRERSSASVGNG